MCMCLQTHTQSKDDRGGKKGKSERAQVISAAGSTTSKRVLLSVGFGNKNGRYTDIRS